MRLESVRNARSSKLERVDSPFEISIPISSTKRQLKYYQVADFLCFNSTYAFTNCRLVDLNGVYSSLFEIKNFIAKGESQLFALHLSGHISSGERPVQNRHRSRQHSFHRLLGKALRIATPFHCHRSWSADVTNNNGRADIAVELSMRKKGANSFK